MRVCWKFQLEREVRRPIDAVEPFIATRSIKNVKLDDADYLSVETNKSESFNLLEL